MADGLPMSRYARQMILPEVGAEGQRLLAQARVLVVGCGGLAAPVLALLAGSGVGRLTLVDGDRVDLSNLHRQTLFTEADCGRPKAEVAAQRCAALNSEISVRPLAQPLTPATAPELVRKSDLVLDCADTYAVSYTLSDCCQIDQRPLVSASVLAFGGYVGGFCGWAPSLRALFPDAPDSGASCATAGVLGPVVGVIGALQAQMALAVLLGLEPSPLGQLIQVDARDFRSSSFRFDTAPEPARPLRFSAANSLHADDLIIDLRGPDDAPAPLHPHALHLPADAVTPDTLNTLRRAPDQRLALCCATGLRAWRAAETIQDHWPGAITLVAASASE